MIEALVGTHRRPAPAPVQTKLHMHGNPSIQWGWTPAKPDACIGSHLGTKYCRVNCVYALPLMAKGLPVHGALLMDFSTAESPGSGV